MVQSRGLLRQPLVVLEPMGGEFLPPTTMPPQHPPRIYPPIPKLQERIARLEAQCRTKHDAAESSIEARLRDKEAIEAENAAAAARLQENEALVSVCSCCVCGCLLVYWGRVLHRRWQACRRALGS